MEYRGLLSVLGKYSTMQTALSSCWKFINPFSAAPEKSDKYKVKEEPKEIIQSNHQGCSLASVLKKTTSGLSPGLGSTSHSVAIDFTVPPPLPLFL